MLDGVVKITGGRSEVQIAELGGGALLSAFDSNNVQQLMTTVEEPINMWKTVTHTFQAKNPSYTDSLLRPVLESSPPIVSVRYGLVAGAASKWRPWEDMIIIGYRVSASADAKSGPLVTLKLCDRLWLMHAVKKAAAHKGAVGAIVEKLWKTDAGGTNSCIEPTTLSGHTPKTGIWYQAYESSWSFLMRNMLPLAVNATGTSGYRIYVSGNALRFHCPGYGVTGVKKLLYTAGTPGFDELAIEDHFIELAGGAGAAGMRRTVYDPVLGEAAMFESSQASLIKFAGSRPHWANFDYRHSHIGQNLSSAEVARNQQYESVLGGEVFKCEFSSDKCMDILVGDILDIVLTPTLNAPTTHTGRWLVTKVVHTLQEGDMSTRYVATRGDYNLPASRPVSSADGVQSDSVSQGIDLASRITLTVAQNNTSTMNTGSEIIVPIHKA